MLSLRRNENTSSESADESSYMASASDLMIGILFIFIILVAYLSFQISKAKTEADPLAQTVRIIGTKLQETKINVGIDEKTGVISLPADILFNSAKYSLKQGGEDVVISAIKILEDILPCYISKTGVTKIEDKCKKDNPSGATIETIYVEGHTDSAPLTKPFPGYDNWHLGLDRARSTKCLLQAPWALIGMIETNLFLVSHPTPTKGPHVEAQRLTTIKTVESN